MNSNTFSTVQKNLEARGYRVQCFSKAEDAVRYLDRTLDGQTIGFGGSMTLEEIGLYEVLAPHNTVYWHQRIPEGQTSQQVRLSANAAPFYISSVNGLAETGEMKLQPRRVDLLWSHESLSHYRHQQTRERL